MNKRTRVLAVLAAGSVLVSAAAVPAVAVPSSPVTGGNVQIGLNAARMRALHSAGYTFAATRPATLSKGVLRLPITGGTATPPNYVTKLAGGFAYTKAGKTIAVTHIVMNTATHKATADVTNHGNIIVFVLGDPNGGNGGPGKVQYGGYSVTLSYAFTHALDHAFRTAMFVNHPAFGTGATTVYFTV